MKTKYYIPALLVGMLSLASCNDNEPSVGNAPASAKEGINFNIDMDSPSSRTQYSTQDWLQIEWLKNDKITIFCEQTQAPTNEEMTSWAPKTKAVYSVTELVADPHSVTAYDKDQNKEITKTITTYSKAHIAIDGSATDALYWGENNEDGTPKKHKFYAAYGDNIGITNDQSGEYCIAVCRYQADQELTLNEETNTWINMNQAYMVAYRETTPVDNVDLHFKPIMTTVEIDVQAPTTGSITIKALEIKIPAGQDKLYLGTGYGTKECYANFDYNILTGKCPTVSTHATDEKFIFTLATPQTLNANNKTVKITAILPPIEISDTYPITITVDANEGSNTAAFDKITTTATTKVVNPGAKVVIKAGDWRKEPQAPTFVDLGLPSGTKWATCNLEATSPEDYGDYFGWGCTIPYASSAVPNWPLYFKKIGGTGTAEGDCGKTNFDPMASYVNGRTKISGTDRDAAYVRLAKQAYMPSREQWQELLDQCDFVKVTKNNVFIGWNVFKNTNNGRAQTHNESEAHIFLPLGGGLDEKNHSDEAGGKQGYYGIGVRCFYWTASPNDASKAYDFVAPQTSSDNADPGVGQYARFHGRTIRPVDKIYPNR